MTSAAPAYHFLTRLNGMPALRLSYPTKTAENGHAFQLIRDFRPLFFQSHFRNRDRGSQFLSEQ